MDRCWECSLAFFFKRVTGTGAFCGMLAGEAAIFAAFLFTGISFLWYNVIGCVVVIATGMAVSYVSPPSEASSEMRMVIFTGQPNTAVRRAKA
jgi:Na+/proline symporter